MGKSGNKYEGIQGPDESLRLFNHIVDNAPILQSYPKSPEAGNPKETYISFDVIAKDKDLSLIYKKHKNDQIAFHSHYDTGSRSWVMHSFPK